MTPKIWMSLQWGGPFGNTIREMQRKKPYHQKKVQAMIGEEKEIKRTLSCQDFVTLHILVQVMFFLVVAACPGAIPGFPSRKTFFFISTR